MIAFAAGLMISACGNSQKNNDKSVDSDSTKDTPTAAQAEEEEDYYDTPSRGIDAIRAAWKSKTIKVDAGTTAPDIKELAFAFCKTYPQCETNRALMGYLNSPESSTKDEYELGLDDGFNYFINCIPKEGYIRCMGEIEVDRFTYGCYWNRENGHKLFAAFMEECWETADWDQCLVVFYDYDPATDVLTPEPALTDMIENRMKDYFIYIVRLPEEGKDIEVVGFESIEEDACADETFTLKWNGNTFNWVD